ncbi:MAG: hypothetical protein II786_05590 [Muribaculaceae bacterium]|nr:hypothetical protein [Muribaculaceae bacterium]
MMKALITVVLTLLALQVFATPTPEEMYGSYDKDGKYRAMQEQVDQINQQSAKNQKEKSDKQSMVMWIAIVIGLIPLGFIGKQVIQEKTWKSNPKRTIQAIAMGLAGGALLFAIDYGIFMLKIEYGTRFNTILVVAFVLFLIIGSIYVLKKKKKE